MSKCYVVHRVDCNNVGDLSSNPLQYFMNKSNYTVVDISEIHLTYFEDKPVIVGGGGLIANDFFENTLQSLTVPSDKNQILNLASQYWKTSHSANKSVRDEFFSKLNTLVKEYIDKLNLYKSKRIVWGAGHNGSYQRKLKGLLEYPDWLRDFDLVSVRDYGQEYHWVPCASCMHSALRKKYTIKNDIVWFEHKKQLVKSQDFGNDSIPRFINSGSNTEQTVELLGSSNIIITNSYHGAYWGALLGKKVIVYEPWSSKFNAIKHRPYILDKSEYWKDIVDSVRTYPDALDECVNANEKYWTKVKQYL